MAGQSDGSPKRWRSQRKQLLIFVALFMALLLWKNVALLLTLHVPDRQDAHEVLRDNRASATVMTVEEAALNSPPNASPADATSPPIGSLFHFIHSSSAIDFGIKEFKAIESVFYHHPKAQVMLWTTEMTAEPVQPIIDKGYNLTVEQVNLKQKVESLLDYPDINSTIIEKFLSRWENHTKSSFWMVNNSDILRLILLYRYGGVYLDTDTITIKPFDDSLRNSVGQQKSTGQSQLNGAVMVFEKENLFIRDCIHDSYGHFNGNQWGRQGPALITRVYRRVNYPTDVVQVQPQLKFYPYTPALSEICFLGDMAKAAKRSKHPTFEDMTRETYVVHTNNKLTGNQTAAPGTPCECLLRAFCVVSKDCTPRCTLFDPPRK